VRERGGRGEGWLGRGPKRGEGARGKSWAKKAERKEREERKAFSFLFFQTNFQTLFQNGI